MSAEQKIRLRFSPTAWSKMLYMRDASDNEVGAFGISSPDDLLYIEDVVIPKQTVGSVTVEFDDEAVADYFDAQSDKGRKPQEYARIWIHTHPFEGMPSPSGTDEATFDRVFGKCDWSVMCIISLDSKVYCRMRLNDRFKCTMLMDCSIDYSKSGDMAAWKKEYDDNVKESPKVGFGAGHTKGYAGILESYCTDCGEVHAGLCQNTLLKAAAGGQHMRTKKYCKRCHEVLADDEDVLCWGCFAEDSYGYFG